MKAGARLGPMLDPRLGTAKGDFVSLTRRVGMSTGGISAACHELRLLPSVSIVVPFFG